MLLASRHLEPHRPPPLWFVSNGDTTVGPVRTDLLCRGVWFGRIPEDCWVRELTWRTWRSLDQIREVRSVLQAQAAGEIIMPDVGSRPSIPRLRKQFGMAIGASEVLSLALGESCNVTGSAFGAVHRAWVKNGPPFTSCVRGIGMISRLGEPISREDPSLTLAITGGLVVAAPESGKAEKAIAKRFGHPVDLGGVAMIPITLGQHLVAVLELGRLCHAFRSSDVVQLESIGRAAALAIADKVR
jgi:hypothetical protein